MNYSTSYILDKAHFEECFSESVTTPLTINNFTKAIVLAVAGLAFLLFSEQDAYVAWFLIGLGVVDAVSLYYRKPWWVLRQLMSRAANNELTLTVDEDGIKNKSHYVNQLLAWKEISEVIETEKGLLVVHQGVRHYLSRRVLSDDAYQYIIAFEDHKA